ncbi:flagellar FlbD family protein [Cellulomonas sp.]
MPHHRRAPADGRPEAHGWAHAALAACTDHGRGLAMIVVTRLTGDRFGINPDLIQRVDSAPDTIITLIDGTKYIVSEPLTEVIGRIDERAAQVLARSQELRAISRLAPVPDLPDDDDEPLDPPLPLRPRSV